MINFLPPQEKKYLLSEEKKKIITLLVILVFLFLIMLSFVLYCLEIYISGELKAQEIVLDQQQKEFESSEIKDFPETIKKANQTFKSINSFYQQRIDLLKVLSELYDLLPEGVYLDSFSYQKKTSQITIAGFAKTRESLVKFRENLEENQNFKDPYFPPSVWLESTDINFNSNFKLENEK